MLRLTAFVTSAVCCTSFLVPTTVPTHRSLLKIRHSGDHIMGSKHDPVRHPYMSSDAPPSYSSDQPVNRRKLLTDTIPAALAIGALGVAGAVTAGPERAFSVAPAPAAKPAPPGSKLVVLGGNGFVGSRVCEILVAAGATVVSVSRSGSKPTKWADGQSWVERVSWTKGDPSTMDLSSVFSGATAVISCVGVIGGSDEDMEKGNGDVNVAAAAQASKAKAGRFVYVSVSHLVPEAFGGAAFQGYFDGKKRAEEAIAKSFPSSRVLIKPTFIYGGDSFGLTPPRVSDGYGSGIDSLLSSGPIRAIAGISPGLIKVALSPPVSRDNVALACVAGALGRLQRTGFDGADEINAAAAQA